MDVSVTGNGVPRACGMGRPNCFRGFNRPTEAPPSVATYPRSTRQAAKESARGPPPGTFKPPPSTRSDPADPPGVCQLAREVLGVRPRARSTPFGTPASLRWVPPKGLASDRAFNERPAGFSGFPRGDRRIKCKVCGAVAAYVP